MKQDFRFERLEIWQDAIALSDALFDISDQAEENKKYRFAEQLRGATMSITNNIAEGAGSDSDKEFARYIQISRNSLYECVNILFIFERRKIIEAEVRLELYNRLLELSKKLFYFKQKLKN